MQQESNSIEEEARRTAKKSGLRYVTDKIPGITRIKKGKNFIYTDAKGHTITDDEILTRIKKIVIPPAWQNVWICPYPNGHLQATGYDVKDRKQYKYHSDWSAIRNENKFGRMLAFAQALPKMRKKISADINQPGFSREKVLAAVVQLIEKGHMRIGNEEYLKENGSFGLTTLRDKHVKISGSKMRFTFKGKKGIEHDIELDDKRLAKIVKQCKDIPGFELFQYFDEEGEKHTIDSGDVNEYIHRISGNNFTAKDFRTWAGTMHAFRQMLMLEPQEQTHKKKQVVEIVKQVSARLGNTPAICRKYYIHPVLIDMCETGELQKFYASVLEDKKHTAKHEEHLFVNFLEIYCSGK